MAKNCGRSGPSGPPRILKNWTILLLSVLMIMLFVTLVAPAIGRMSGIRTAVTAIREDGIEAGAYFYTDVEKVREAELYIRHAREFSPDPDRP